MLSTSFGENQIEGFLRENAQGAQRTSISLKLTSLVTFLFSDKKVTHNKFRTSQLQTGIDIRSNIPNIILKILITVLQLHLHLPDGVQHRGVIPVELPSNVGQTQIGQLPDQIHRNLPSLGSALVLLAAPEHNLVNGVELANLADDQTGTSISIFSS